MDSRKLVLGIIVIIITCLMLEDKYIHCILAFLQGTNQKSLFWFNQLSLKLTGCNPNSSVWKENNTLLFWEGLSNRFL